MTDHNRIYCESGKFAFVSGNHHIRNIGCKTMRRPQGIIGPNAFAALLFATTVNAFFGLSSRKPLQDSVLFHSMSNRTDLCAHLGLQSKHQDRSCRRSRGVVDSLVEAIRLSVAECHRLFEFERWNCSIDSTRINILRREFKETSFLYAMSSAGLVHAIARSCSSGRLNQCTCDESFDAAENRRTWLWGGCGDNVLFGQNFARRFMRHKRHRSRDLRALMDTHNTKVGIQVVQEKVTKACKCHGVSGSCTMQTCWKQLARFYVVGDELKRRYENAIEASAPNEAVPGSQPSPPSNFLTPSSSLSTLKPEGFRKMRASLWKQMKKQKKHKNSKSSSQSRKKSDLVDGRVAIGASGGDTSTSSSALKGLIYLDRSPNFCMTGRYSHGTVGRQCHKGTNCNEMCCGRGHNVQMKTDTGPCKCRVVWCCHVQCETCVTRYEVYTCK